MRSKLDLQVHWTTKSRVLSAEDLVTRAYSTLGTNSVVGLVGCMDARYEAMQRDGFEDRGNAVYSPRDNVMIVKGQEVKTKDGDLVVMALKAGQHLKDGRPFQDSIKEALDHNGILIVSTPYLRNARLGEILRHNTELFRHIDAIETHNGSVPQSGNTRAEVLYQFGRGHSRHLGAVGSSDAHRKGDAMTSYFEAELPNLDSLQTPEKVTSALRDAVRNSTPSDIIGTRMYFGPLAHYLLIGAMVAADKKAPEKLKQMWPLRVLLNRGDKEALHS